MNYDDMTIAQAKAELRKELHEGFECPLCKQHAKLYSRPLTSSMAAGLILLYNESKTDYIHIENFFKGVRNATPSMRGDIPKLRFWGLIQPKQGETNDGNPNNGYYALTKQGIEFVEGKISVPSHVDIYNNKFYGYSVKSKNITIFEALKEKFNYNEIIRNEKAEA